MGEKWNIRIWGTRGSLPMTGRDYLEYGGNTSCISVDCKDELIVFDGGSGLMNLAKELIRQEKPRPLRLFFSHSHIDHMIGLMGFSPFYRKEWEIHLYGEAREGLSFRRQIERLAGPPYWPMGLDDLQAKIHIHEIKPKDTLMAGPDIAVKTMRGSHPGNVLLYSLEGQGKKVVYSLDCEPDEEMLRQMADFSKGADIIFWDAQYTPLELKDKAGWGHSSWKQGLRLRQMAQADKIVMAHYSWEYTDEILKAQEEEALKEEPSCCFGREGMEFHI